jgi:hypothetical protein
MLDVSTAKATELARPQRTFIGPTGFEILMSTSRGTESAE